MRYLVAAGRAAVVAAAGVVVGVASVAVHALALGLPLAVAAPAASTWAMPPGWSRRVAFVLGWCAVVGVASNPRGTGSYLVSGTLPGYVLLGTAFALLLAAVVTTLKRPTRRPADRRPDAPDGAVGGVS